MSGARRSIGGPDPAHTEGSSRLEALEAEVRSLARTIAGLDERLRRLESPAEASGAHPTDAAAVAHPHLEAGAAQGAVALVGRTLVVLGGGYLLRAITEAGTVPSFAGALLGLVYALGFLLLARREAGAGRRLSADFHGVAAGLMAYPLVWETTTRFDLLSPAASYALLLGILLAGLAVAVARKLQAVAWAHTLLFTGVAVLLLAGTHHLVAALGASLAAALVLEAMAVRERWPSLRWPVALAADGAVLLAGVVLSRPQGLPPDYPPIAASLAFTVALLVPALHLASLAVRTVALGRRIGVFDAVQGVLLVVLGVGPLRWLASAAGAPEALLPVLALVVGLGCYAAAYGHAARRPALAANVLVDSLVATALLVLAGRALLAGEGRILAFGILGLIATLLARRSHAFLEIHALAYLGMGLLEAGGLGGAARALYAPDLGRVAGSFAWLTAALMAVAGYLILAAGQEVRRLEELVARTALAALGGWSSAGLLAVGLAVATGARDVGHMTAAGTGAMAVVTVALAWGAGRGRLRELGWLVYPFLVLGGAKLLVEDLRRGRPATLFVSLVFYGYALIVAPRMAKRSS